MKKPVLVLSVLLAISTVMTFELVDDLGRLVSIDKTPGRVVIASPAITYYLELLDVTHTIVGVTDWDSFALSREVTKI